MNSIIQVEAIAVAPRAGAGIEIRMMNCLLSSIAGRPSRRGGN